MGLPDADFEVNFLGGFIGEEFWDENCKFLGAFVGRLASFLGKFFRAFVKYLDMSFLEKLFGSIKALENLKT